MSTYYRLHLNHPTNIGIPGNWVWCKLCNGWLEPVTVDEWHDYEKEKPTKEDFEPTGYIDTLDKQGKPYHLYPKDDGAFWNDTTCWRRITPPVPPNPKSKSMITDNCEIEVFQDGSAKIEEGGETVAITKSELDALIAARGEVMEEK